MKKMLIFFVCIVMAFSFTACQNNAAFTEAESGTVVAKDGTKYTFVGVEGEVWCFGEWEFIGHVAGEKKEFSHLDADNKIKTGMYSVGGDRDVLMRYFPDNEFASVYAKSDLLKTEITLDNCIKFTFLKESPLNNAEATLPNKGITECETFLNEIRNGQKAEEAGLYDLVKQPDGMLENCYIYGYVCGVVQEDINIVIPLEVKSFDDKAYSISLGDEGEFVLPKEWIDKLQIK